MKTTAEILAQVSGFVPTTGLALKMSRRMGVYTSRPMLFIPAETPATAIERQFRQAA